MSGQIERFYWWWMLKTSKIVSIGGMRFLHMSALNNRPAAEIDQSLRLAFARISAARDGFPELVGSHLRFVVAIDSNKDSVVLKYARGYASRFPDLELNDPHYLACRLIWAATYVRLFRNADGNHPPPDMAAICAAAQHAQRRFTSKFDDAGRWAKYLDTHPDGI